MASEIKYCGSCGAANSVLNNFCTKCGSSLIQEVIEPIKSQNAQAAKISKRQKATKPDIPLRYQSLHKKLLKLSNREGDIYVHCRSHFIHFVKKMDDNTLYVDLGIFTAEDEQYIPKVLELGYQKVEAAFEKQIPFKGITNLVHDAINETELVFKDVYNLPAEEEFVFEENYGKRFIIKPDETNATKKEGSGKAIAFIIIIILAMLGYCNRDKTQDSDQSNQSSNPKLDIPSDLPDAVAAYVISQQFMTDHLVNPKGADYPMIKGEWNVHFNSSDTSYRVASYVDHKNPFNAEIRTKYFMLLKYLGGDENDKFNWQVLSLEVQ